MIRPSYAFLAGVVAVLAACTTPAPSSTPDSRSAAEGLAIPTPEELSRMAEIAARNAEVEKPEAIVDWRADVPTTASETLVGEWDMRVLSAYGHLPEKHNRLFITAMHDGLVEGHIWGGDGDGVFVDGRVREEDGKTILAFKTPQAGAGWWSRVNAEAPSSTIGLCARRANETDDLGAYLTWKNWMLCIVDTPEDFCRDT